MTAADMAHDTIVPAIGIYFATSSAPSSDAISLVNCAIVWQEYFKTFVLCFSSTLANSIDPSCGMPNCLLYPFVRVSTTATSIIAPTPGTGMALVKADKVVAAVA